MFTFNNTPTKSKLTHQGSFGGVVEAFCDSCAEPVSFVTYARSGTDFIITKFGIHPRCDVKEAQLAGDIMDAELAKEAQRLGVTKLFVVHHNDQVELVRTYQPCISALTQLSATNRPTYIN